MDDNGKKQTSQTSRTVLYNMIFPLWLLILYPGWWWLLLIPANFAIDSFVLKKCFEKKEIPERKKLLKKYAWKTCIFGFISDFLGAVFLLLVFAGIYDIGKALMDNGNEATGLALLRWSGSSEISSWNNPIAFIIYVIATAISARLIYLFNRRMLRKNDDIGEESAKYTAFWLSVFTAPYLFLLPFYFR